MVDRVKAIRRNRASFGLPPLQPADIAAKAVPRQPVINSRSGKPAAMAQVAMVGHTVRRGEFAGAFKPPKGIIMVAGIPAVAVGARLPGERRLKRKKRG